MGKRLVSKVKLYFKDTYQSGSIQGGGKLSIVLSFTRTLGMSCRLSGVDCAAEPLRNNINIYFLSSQSLTLLD